MKFPAAVYIALEDPLDALPFAEWLLSLRTEPGLLRLDVRTGSLDPEFEVPTDMTHVHLEAGSFRVVVHAEWKLPPEGERVFDELEANHNALAFEIPKLCHEVETVIWGIQGDIAAAERLMLTDVVASEQAKLVKPQRELMGLFERERASAARVRELGEEAYLFLDGFLVPLVGRLYAKKLGHHTFHVRVAAYTEWSAHTVSAA